VQDTVIVAIEVEYETTPELPNGVTSDDLEWLQPPVSKSPYSSKMNISQTWRRAGFLAIAELGLVS